MLLRSLVLVLAACAHTHVTIPDPVGPDPSAQASSQSDGALVVYTAERSRTMLEESGLQIEHLPYAIYEAGGRLVAQVKNRHATDEAPDAVRLPPGVYVVRAPGLAALGGTLRRVAEVELTARVDAGKTTTVHLDRPWSGASGPLAVYAAPDWPVGFRVRQ